MGEWTYLRDEEPIHSVYMDRQRPLDCHLNFLSLKRELDPDWDVVSFSMTEIISESPSQVNIVHFNATSEISEY